ncbi:hypothetical protein HUS23_02150 [Ectothiorhodospiraceae bacterium 2226]|nr:hypothetical protein HUS23_02150 [Ectothiorhodospiraceae bacterium 2226]
MFAYQLERNAMGQITARTETLPDGSTRQYEYGYDERSTRAMKGLGTRVVPTLAVTPR